MLLSDGYTEGKLTGIELVQQSLSQHLGPWAPSFWQDDLLFAFSSIVGNYYYGEINIGFISKKLYDADVVPCFRSGVWYCLAVWLKLPGMGSGRSVYGADGDNEFSGDRDFRQVCLYCFA